MRGENVVLIGEVHQKATATQTNKLELVKVNESEIVELQRVEQKRLESERNKKKALLERCFSLAAHTDSVLDEYY